MAWLEKEFRLLKWQIARELFDIPVFRAGAGRIVQEKGFLVEANREDDPRKRAQQNNTLDRRDA